MVAEAANTQVTVLEPPGSNKYGEALTPTTPVYSGPAVLIDDLQSRVSTSSPTPTGVRVVTLVLPAFVPVTNRHQVRNDLTGDLYAVAGFQKPPSLMGAPVDRVVILQLITT